MLCYKTRANIHADALLFTGNVSLFVVPSTTEAGKIKKDLKALDNPEVRM
jgi:hypothetical protein